MWSRIVKFVVSMPFVIAASLFVLYLAFGFFLVDPLAKKMLPWIGEKKLASQLSVQKVDFNPLSLEATVQGLKLAELNGKPLASFDRLYLNLDVSGLFRWAWRIQDIQLNAPRANFVVGRDGKLNWASLIDKLNEDKTPPKDTLPRVLIGHIKIAQGDIAYTDANRAGEPFKLSLQPLGIELDGLSTLPEDRGHYLIAAKLPEQGGTLKWRGDVSLNPVKSDGEIALENLNLPNLLKVIKTPRNYVMPSGTLAAGARYRFALVSDKPWLQVNGANLIVQNLALAPRSGAPVLALAEAKIDNANFDLATRSVKVAALGFSGGKLAATRAINGVLDWQTLFSSPPPVSAASSAAPAVKSNAAQPNAAQAAAPPWNIEVQQVRANDWSARFTDQGFVRPLGVEATGFNLEAKVSGTVGVTTAIQVGPVAASLGPLKLFSGTEGVAQLDRVQLENANFDVAANKLSIDAIALSGIKTAVTLDKQKRMNWNAILAKHPGAAADAPKAPGASALELALGRLSVDGVQLAVSDDSLSKPVRLDIVNGHAQMQNLSLDLNRAVPIDAALSIKQGGSFSASGNITPGKSSGQLKLKLAALSLKPFAPYVNQAARLDLQSGVAASAGKLSFSPTKAGLNLTYDGGFAVNSLAITEEDTHEAFLGWERLASDSLVVNLLPLRVQMNELAAVKPFGKVIIFEDRSINLKRILRGSTPEVAGATPANALPPAPENDPKSAAQSSDEKSDFAFGIERLRIADANAEFADLSLTPQFGTRMHSLSGVVTGLSNNPASVAQVELDGKVDEFGSARVRGSIQPFKATDFTDLKLTFRNLEMANMTPYSGKFAGRKIDSGKLSVDLEYKIKNRQLAGDNKFIINKLKLGERVDSPTAMNLPLDLAIALLEDSDGIIDLDLPVSGSLDDPQFSYGKIIWKAVVNVLTKLVTAPFRALGKLLGVSSDKMEAVTFDPGSNQLLPPEQEKLKTLSQAMAKRPALTLTIEPGYDPESDRRALQELAMRREVAVGTGIKLAPQEEPGPVDVNNFKTQTLLEDLYAERSGKEDYQKLRTRYREKSGVAAIVDSELVERLGRKFKSRDTGPVSALHTELLERLTQKTQIADAALVKLAQARGQTMRDALLREGLDGGRLSVTAPVKHEARDKQIGSKLSLGAGKVMPASALPDSTLAPAK
ncbi:MAG: DUF748 domain-containing protein [Thiobacillaceae bacterium]